jgi:hypothetical protein
MTDPQPDVARERAEPDDGVHFQTPIDEEPVDPEAQDGELGPDELEGAGPEDADAPDEAPA